MKWKNYKFYKFSFGLFEAMSAIELMDPKMDAGMLENQSQAKIKTFKQAIQVNFVYFAKFSLIDL